MSGFGGCEFALCHKTFRQMMELSGKVFDAPSMLACMAVLRLRWNWFQKGIVTLNLIYCW